MKRIPVVRKQPALALVGIEGKTAFIERLAGMATCNAAVPKIQGLAIVTTSRGRIEGDGWRVESFAAHKESLRLVLCAQQDALRLESLWEGCPDTGVVSRRDKLVNQGRSAITIFKCQARVAFPPARYEIYAQDSRWCNESQGAWMPLHAGAISLTCASGRTTQGGTPYACLRRVGAREGLAFHVLPVGNWAIHFRAHTGGDGPPVTVVELGLADENMRVVLPPGGVLELPELLFQSLPDGEPHMAAPALHRFLLNGRFASAKPQAGVVYNTWFDQFEILDVPRLRRQLAAAKRLGCEVFTIDAGWYGAGEGSWWEQAGDWREKTKSAFKGQMREFADEVRKVGLGFGIWMEPERFSLAAPIRKHHPEWFIPMTGPARIDLTIPEAYEWQKQEISRLVETYDLVWMKIDFNFEMDRDPSGAELSAYYRAWYRLVDEIRSAYPRTFFEGCASGALRTDLESLSHFDNYFLSDTVHPVDALRIMQGTYLRLLPGRIGRWAVLRSVGRALACYGKRAKESPAVVLTPCGGMWEPSETTDLDFAILAAMPGMLGFSGDIAGLPPEVIERIQRQIGFFKKRRRMIAASVAHLLTPPELIGSRTGWIGFQLQSLSRRENLLFVFRLGPAGEPPPWRLRQLDPQRTYSVQAGIFPRSPKSIMSGADLMNGALAVAMPAAGSSKANIAVVYSIAAKSR